MTKLTNVVHVSTITDTAYKHLTFFTRRLKYPTWISHMYGVRIRIRTIHQMSRLPATLSPLSGNRSMPLAIITANCLSLATFTASATVPNDVTHK